MKSPETFINLSEAVPPYADHAFIVYIGEHDNGGGSGEIDPGIHERKNLNVKSKGRHSSNQEPKDVAFAGKSGRKCRLMRLATSVPEIWTALRAEPEPRVKEAYENRRWCS